MFFGFFGSGNRTIVTREPVRVRLEELKRISSELKVKRLEHMKAIARSIGADESELPTGRKEWDAWITKNLYNGVDAQVRRRLIEKGTGLRLSPAIYKLVRAIREINDRISTVKTGINDLKSGNKPALVSESLLATAAGVDRIGKRATEVFKLISPASSFLDRLELEVSRTTRVSLSVECVLQNGKRVPPERLFSEANLDLIALLLFIMLCQEAAEQGQAQVLVLDDVLQSVDSSIRMRVVEYLLEEMPEWQFMMTVHDRLWAETLRVMFRRFNHSYVEHEIVGWSFAEGPRIKLAERGETTALEKVLESGEVHQICSEAGMLLEQMCGTLSWSLATSVVRRQGDRYTIGDLWPGVLKVLKRTELQGEAAQVDRLLHLRNWIGSHYNEWAKATPRHDAVEFGNAILGLCRRVLCQNCSRWIEELRTTGGSVVGWSCKCGAITFLR